MLVAGKAVIGGHALRVELDLEPPFANPPKQADLEIGTTRGSSRATSTLN